MIDENVIKFTTSILIEKTAMLLIMSKRLDFNLLCGMAV